LERTAIGSAVYEGLMEKKGNTENPTGRKEEEKS